MYIYIYIYTHLVLPGYNDIIITPGRPKEPPGVATPSTEVWLSNTCVNYMHNKYIYIYIYIYRERGREKERERERATTDTAIVQTSILQTEILRVEFPGELPVA